jgi:hypothetical protein
VSDKKRRFYEMADRAGDLPPLIKCKHPKRTKASNGLSWYCLDCQLIVPAPANRPW